VIAVIGSPRARVSGDDADVAGLAASIAVAAAADGARVELVGRLGDDPAGDAVLLALARRGVGHVAVLRDPARPTPVVADEDVLMDPEDTAPEEPPSATPDPPTLDAGDLDLALRYLPELAVIVAVHVDGDVLAGAIAASGWAETSLVVVVAADAGTPGDLPTDAVTIAVADEDDSATGALIGRYAAAIDRGEAARTAYDSLLAAVAG
jgi:hypothetical protein